MSIDGWTCNVGPNQFQFRLILEIGRVARFYSLAEGYSDPARKERPVRQRLLPPMTCK